jgi:hypothetical protein
MAARDDTDLDEALEILSNRVEENNREVEESLENIYGDLEEHDEQIIEIAHFTRHNRDRIEENFENIDDLWHEIDDIYDEIDDVDGGTTNYNIDFTGIEKTVKYIGGGIRNFFSWGREKSEDFDPDRRKVLGAVAGAAVVDYSNIIPGDKNAGEGIGRLGQCGGDIDGFGVIGEQERCAPKDNGRTQQPGNGGGDPVDTTESEYGDEVQIFTYDGNKAIDDDEFGSYEELLDEYEDNAALEEMLTEDYTDGDVFVAENDRVYAGGGQANVKVEGVWEDVKDGEVDGQ